MAVGFDTRVCNFAARHSSRCLEFTSVRDRRHVRSRGRWNVRLRRARRLEADAGLGRSPPHGDRAAGSPSRLRSSGAAARRAKPDRRARRRRHNLWQVDLTTGALTRLTDDSGNHRPVASPDGRFFAFSSDRTKPRSLFRQFTDGRGEPQRLTTSTADQNVTSWSHDGRWLAFEQAGPKTLSDIWLLPLDGEGKPRPFLQTRYVERNAVFSPDGQWIAYASEESGRSEVMIRAFSGEGPRKQVSIAGGQTPAFSSDGKTLYYRMNNQIWAAAIATDPFLTIGAPTVAFELPGVPGVSGLPNYVVNRSGDRVLASSTSATPVVLTTCRSSSTGLTCFDARRRSSDHQRGSVATAPVTIRARADFSTLTRCGRVEAGPHSHSTRENRPNSRDWTSESRSLRPRRAREPYLMYINN